MSEKKEDKTPVATNRRARHNFHVLDTLEAGLSLTGPEVKSLRLKQASLDQSFARLEGSEALIYGLHIAPYAFDTLRQSEPLRTRKLLLNRKEIKKLIGQTSVKGMALIPLELYFRRGWAKVLLGLCKNKQAPDKRDDIKKRDMPREVGKEFKGKYRG